MGLITLPSGAKYCRVAGTIKRGFDDADKFCKAAGLSGLAEPETPEDFVYMSGLLVCTFFFPNYSSDIMKSLMLI
jgi:hypothetical protein